MQDRCVFRRRRSRRRYENRRGAAAVEFALVAPLLFLTIALPITEFGRAMMVSELLGNAARTGCRVGVLPGNDNAAVISAINSLLAGQGINGATTTILVNGASGNVSTASRGATITVTVSVPYNNVSWLPAGSSFFLAGKTLTGSQVMRHE